MLLIVICLVGAAIIEPHVTSLLTGQPRQGALFTPRQSQAVGSSRGGSAVPGSAPAGAPSGTRVRITRAPGRTHPGPRSRERQTHPGTVPGTPDTPGSTVPGTPGTVPGSPGNAVPDTPGRTPRVVQKHIVTDRSWTLRVGRAHPPEHAPDTPPGAPGTALPKPADPDAKTAPGAPKTGPDPTPPPAPANPTTPTAPPTPPSPAVTNPPEEPVTVDIPTGTVLGAETLPAHIDAGKAHAAIYRDVAEQIRNSLVNLAAGHVSAGESLGIQPVLLAGWVDVQGAVQQAADILTSAADQASTAAIHEEATLRPVVEHAGSAPLQGTTVEQMRGA